MTWTTHSTALVDDDHTGKITSTSTVLVPTALASPIPKKGGPSLARLRMFGLNAKFLSSPGYVVDSKPVGPGSSWTNQGLDPASAVYQEYLVGRQESREFDMNPTYQTRIPLEKKNQTWLLEYISADAISIEMAESTLDVEYKDPSVVELPDGSWLMVMVRTRREADTDPSPELVIADIVAWVSPDPSFASPQVMGPFLLVDSLEAFKQGAFVRVWLGVPGAVVDSSGTELLVYYVVEEAGSPGKKPPLDEYVDYGAYSKALTTAGFQQRGIYLKRFSLDMLAASFEWEASNEGMLTDESGSTALEGIYGQGLALPGTLAGRVSIEQGTTLGWGGPSFEEVYDGGGYAAGGPKVADPQPAYGASGRLHLYFAAVMSPEGGSNQVFLGSGHGIWLVTEVMGSGGTRFTFEAPKDGELSSSSQLLSSFLSILLDPDPVMLSDGTWCLFVGQANPDNTEPIGTLLRYEGTSEDGDPGGPTRSLAGLLGWVDTSIPGSFPVKPGFPFEYWNRFLVQPFNLTSLWQAWPVGATMVPGAQVVRQARVLR